MITIICNKDEKELLINALDGSIECIFLHSDIKCVPSGSCGDCVRANITWRCANDEQS